MKSILQFFSIGLLFLSFKFSFSQTKQIWGVNTFEGAENGGFIYKVDTNGNNFTKAFEFSRNQGENPFGSLLDAGNGVYYGTTYDGGESSNGVLFNR